ncbi:MAG TPA: IPTL-CTERM sorting domain-containing protein [Thermoanaerobaculia bacterium]|jgi:sugar lactone lactonase YvrE
MARCRERFVVTTTILTATILVVVALTNQAAAATINFGDILVTDLAGSLIRVDAVTGGQTLISSGGMFVAPFGIAIEFNGHILVADEFAGAVFRVDPVSGNQMTLASNFISPTAIAIDANGDIFVTDFLLGLSYSEKVSSPAVTRVDPATGTQTPVVLAGNTFCNPTGIAIDANGDLIVADEGVQSVFRIDPVSGAVTTLSSGGLFMDPVGIAIEANGNILVGDFSVGIIRVDPVTGTQTLLTSGGSLVNPFHLALDLNGDILVADFQADAVIRVNPTTGAQSIVSSGTGIFPAGIAIWKISTPIPTLSEWGMISLVLLLLSTGTVMMHRRSLSPGTKR